MNEEPKPKQKTGPKGPRLTDDQKRSIHLDIAVTPVQHDWLKEEFGTERGAVARGIAGMVEKARKRKGGGKLK